MGTAKRERQKLGRYERMEAARAAQQRNRRLRTIRNWGIVAVLIVAGAFVASTQFGDDSDDVATDSTTSTTAATDTSSTSTTAPLPAVAPTCPATDGSAPVANTFTGPPELCIDPAKSYSATFETTEGNVTLQLDDTTVPNATNAFVFLARYHYFDGTKLFRTDPSIGIIQGGSPHTQDNSDPGPGFNVQDEGGTFDFVTNPQGKGPFTYAAGDIVYARSQGPNSSGGQFFFGVNDSVKALDAQGTYLKFGTVTAGLDVLEKILALHQADDSGLGGKPSRDVVVNKVTITEA